jgi:poly(A) polymerase/tRNA nucleotidyltransferase (CCA-adding enzyme)
MKYEISEEVRTIGKTLTGAGFDAYLVGGCVRDLLLGREPKDWDVATNARPEEIQKLFVDSVYENQFGTVGVKTGAEDPKLKVIEVTTFRIEGKYSDKRHPDEIKFAKTMEEDLSRRDFTCNAIALRIDANIQIDTNNTNVIDPFGGQKDLKEGVIRTVGKPEERFTEDALRLMRAVRFAIELDDFSAKGGSSPGGQIDLNTRRAIEKLSSELEVIAKERIRDEFIKILEMPHAAKGIILLEELNLLRFVLPELRDGLGVGQNKHHIYSVFEHSVRALDYAAQKNYSLEVRLASLLHDVGKPATKEGDGPDSTFYRHEYVGAKMAAKALDRLRFQKNVAEKVIHLVRYHLFYYNVGEVSEAGVRRFLARVGPENVDDLLKVREADRIGSGVPKAFPYKLRHLLFMIDKVKHDPISPKMLKVNGEDVMKILGIPPCPKVGFILSVLLEEVLDDPKRNMKEGLEERIEELGKMPDGELKKLSERAREKKDEFEMGVEEDMKKKHNVK